MQNLTEEGTKTFHPLILIILLVLLVFLGMIGFAGIATGVLFAFTDLTVDKLALVMTNPTDFPEYRASVLIYQGFSALGAFVIAPLFFIRSVLKKSILDFFPLPPEAVKNILLVFFIMMSFMVINSVTIYWNQNLDLPEWLSWFENYAQSSEAQLAELTKYITTFDSAGYFLLAFIIVAIIPGIGEELLFRGLIQNMLHKWFKNPHVAIWMAGLFFSAFHNQFYGFVPRMLLGVLFGYLYYFSGNLTLTMIAHFINNGFMLIMLYLNQSKIIEYDIEGDESIPGAPTLIFFTILTAGLIYYFYKSFKNKKNGELAKGI